MLLTLFIVTIVMIFAVGILQPARHAQPHPRCHFTGSAHKGRDAADDTGRGAHEVSMAQAQTFAITLIVIEVIVTAIAAGIIIGVFNHNGSVDTRKLTNLKE